jgi:hypothetical protein
MVFNNHRIGAAILSHHVNSFTLVSAFFLFSIGCLHMFVGLIFREKVKPRRSITAWKERAKDVLPAPAVSALKMGQNFSENFHHQNPTQDIFDKIRSEKTGDSGLSRSTTDPAKGFGRQLEADKIFVNRTVLPRYNGLHSPEVV